MSLSKKDRREILDEMDNRIEEFCEIVTEGVGIEPDRPIPSVSYTRISKDLAIPMLSVMREIKTNESFREEIEDRERLVHEIISDSAVQKAGANRNMIAQLKFLEKRFSDKYGTPRRKEVTVVREIAPQVLGTEDRKLLAGLLQMVHDEGGDESSSVDISPDDLEVRE